MTRRLTQVMKDPAMPGYPLTINAQTAKSWLDQGDTLLVDVREPDEYAREHIPGARLQPLSSFNPADLSLGSATRLVVHCASGARSARAAERLQAAGIPSVAHLAGGLPAWRDAGYDVVVDRTAPLPIMRQVQIVAGTLILLGVGLGALIHPAFYGLAGFVGAGLLLAGATGWCGMAMLLARLPYNQPR
jgi:rhodanese-related sulfurtransferase